MAKNVQLLLLKTIENLGIVGDVVKVKPGFARNYLLPMGLAEKPTPTRIEALKEDREKAQAELAALRSAREELLERMNSVEITLVRSCNDQGVLYGSVTQRDIADALQEGGFDVGTRSVRLPQPIRRASIALSYTQVADAGSGCTRFSFSSGSIAAYFIWALVILSKFIESSCVWISNRSRNGLYEYSP